jgi:hypothetical protein
MGIVELTDTTLLISSHIIIYGSAANEALAERIGREIHSMWNEPQARIQRKGQLFTVRFQVTAQYRADIRPEEVLGNDDPRNNYFRVEPEAAGNISFVDGLGCNTGYFLLENLYEGSTTAAHEYGHTLGLPHPHNVDYRGKGVPGIMYPRGTWVDPAFQYDPQQSPGKKGGTLYPIHRRVRQEDIDDLKLHRLPFHEGHAVLGEFSSIWHPSPFTGEE